MAVTAAATLATSAVGGEATLTLGSVGAEPGTIVRVPVSLSTDDLVGAIDFVVDASGLVIADVASNEELAEMLNRLPLSAYLEWEVSPLIPAQQALDAAKWTLQHGAGQPHD